MRPFVSRLVWSVRRGVFDALYATGLLGLWLRRVNRDRAVVLMYHRVLGDSAIAESGSSPGIVVRRATFERQLQLLRRYFRPLSLDQFAEHIRTRQPFPSGACLVTFDDGWLDTFTEAWPLMQRYHVPALVFLPAGFLGTGRMFWQEQLTFVLRTVCRQAAVDETCREELRRVLQRFAIEAFDPTGPAVSERIDAVVQAQKRRDLDQVRDLVAALAQLGPPDQTPHATVDAFMTWEMVHEMAKGGTAFGAHSVSHRLMTTLTATELVEEVRGSRDAVRQQLAPAIESFSYPNGDFNQEVRDVVGQHGFRLAFSTQRGAVDVADDPLTISRVNIHEGGCGSAGLFLARVGGLA